VERVRQKLRDAARRAADEEDVALSAFDSFFRAAEQGRFPRLDDRHDLWQLLVLIADRKACDLIEHERRQKRGGGKVLDESAGPGLAQVVDREPTPQMAAEVAEECKRLLDVLKDDQLRRVALWKMEGYTNDEIAAKLGRSRPTVERKLDRIRCTWKQELGHE